MDLTGPEAVKSASGNLYVMNIVDDYSSHPWTFCLKLKTVELRLSVVNGLALFT